MSIPNATREFIENLIDYYISEVPSYRQIAESFIPVVDSVSDTAFGIITGCVYSSFQQTYTDKGKKPDLNEIKEFYEILNNNAAKIKKSILEASIENLDKIIESDSSKQETDKQLEIN